MWQVWGGQTGETTGQGDCGIPSQLQPCLLLHRWLASMMVGADLFTNLASCWFIKKMEIADSSWGTMGSLVQRWPRIAIGSPLPGGSRVFLYFCSHL